MSKISGLPLLLIIIFELLLKYNFECITIFMLWYCFLNWGKGYFPLLNWSYCTPIFNQKKCILFWEIKVRSFLTKLKQFSHGTQMLIGAGDMERGTWLIDVLIHVCTTLNEKLNALWVTSTELTESSQWEIVYLKQSALKSASAWYLGEEYAVVLLCRLQQHALFIHQTFHWAFQVICASCTDWLSGFSIDYLAYMHWDVTSNL